MIDCSSTVPPLKRGDSFGLAGPGTLPAGTWTARSQVREKLTGALVDDLDVRLETLTDPVYTHALALSMDATATASWPLGQLECDVQFVDGGGVVRSTQTFVIPVVQDVTRDGD